MPKGDDGVVAVAMCSRDKDMQELNVDVEWNELVMRVG